MLNFLKNKYFCWFGTSARASRFAVIYVLLRTESDVDRLCFVKCDEASCSKQWLALGHVLSSRNDKSLLECCLLSTCTQDGVNTLAHDTTLLSGDARGGWDGVVGGQRFIVVDAQQQQLVLGTMTLPLLPHSIAS